MLKIEELTQLINERNYLRIINSITGLNTFGSEPSKPEITVIYPSLNEEEEPREESKDFVSLFITAPPFEPASYPRIAIGRIEFQGAYVWFMRPKSGDLFDKRSKRKIREYALRADIELKVIDESNSENEEVEFSIDKSAVILGVNEKGYSTDTIRIKKVIMINLLSLYESSILVSLKGEGGGRTGVGVRIKYGAEYLSRIVRWRCRKRLSQAGECLDKINDWLRRSVASTRSKLYYIGSLDYMTYCYGGRYITTDPLANKLEDINRLLSEERTRLFDPRCPLCSERHSRGYRRGFLCRQRDGLGLFHYSRRVFPKVYPSFKHSIRAMWPASEVEAPFTVRLVDGTPYVIKVEGLSMILPNVNALRIKLEKKPYAELRRTNGIVVLINEDFVRALVSIIYSAKKDSQPFFTLPGSCVGGRWSLYDVLYAKYLLSKYDGVFGTDYKRDKNGHKIVMKNGEDWLTLWRERERDPLDPNFVRFVGRVLSHTIAHILIQKVSEVLGISLDSLLYVYDDVDKGNSDRYYIAGVFEYSKGGILQLDKEIEIYLREKYKGIDKDTALKMFVVDAIRETLDVYDSLPKVLTGHEKCRKIRDQIKELVDAYSSLGQQLIDEIVDEIENFIREFTLFLDDNKIRLDFTAFKYMIEKAIHGKGDLYDKVMDKVRKKVQDEGDRALLRQFVNELIDMLIEFYAPPICMDGCFYDIHLEKHCSASIFESILTSRGLLNAFAVVAGFGKAGTVRVKSSSLYKLLKSARRELEILTAFTKPSMIDALRALMMDKERENVRVSFILSRDRAGERSLIDEIKKTEGRLPGRFEFRLTEMPSHEKRYAVDDIDITTSWNFTSPGEKYETVSFYYRPLSRRH